jgi:hypothetical protein
MHILVLSEWYAVWIWRLPSCFVCTEELYSWNRVLLETLIVNELVKKCDAFWNVRYSFQKIPWLYLIWMYLVHSLPSSVRSILMLFNHHCLGLTCFLSCRFYHRISMCISCFPHACHTFRPSRPRSNRFDIILIQYFVEISNVQYPRTSVAISRYSLQHIFLGHPRPVFVP